MRIIINLLLLALIVVLGYLLVSGITEPIDFRAQKERRKNVVVDKMMDIRTSQEMFRSIKGHFAGSFDELSEVLKTDSIPFEQVFGDPDDPENTEKFVYNTIYFSAYDSIKGMGIDLDDLRFVPFAPEGTVFDIAADTIEYQKTIVPVVEVGTLWKNFMGKFGDARYQKYDDSYDPQARIKFGDMATPNISGNWE